jgi:hypothetical protein
MTFLKDSSFSEWKNDLKPFLSLLFIISTLFILVFMQMEERRLGYVILKLTHAQRQVVEEKRVKTMEFARLTRPQHVEKMAQSKFTLKKVQSSQIIHLTGAENLVAKDIN